MSAMTGMLTISILLLTERTGPLASLGYLALFGLCILFLISASFTPFIYFNF